VNLGMFVGYVGRNANLQKTPSGKAVADFSIAIDNGKDGNGKERDPTWIKAVLWEKKAEALAQYITKGKMIAVSGPVDVEAWKSKQGEAQASIVVTVHQLTFCGGGEKK
jgi:single-strand DNA-binding protein